MKKILFLFLFFTASLLSGDGFAPETLIKTVDGYTPIEKIEVGQTIQSFDCKNNEITINPVIAKHHYRAKSYLVITLEDEKITCSRNQKFYLPALGTWIKAKDLLHDKNIRDCFCQEFAVLDIAKIEEPKELHTFTINPHHNFFITESNILAHNFAPAVAIPLITYSAGEGFILFGGLTATGVAGVIYRESIKEVVKGVVEKFNGKGVSDTIDYSIADTISIPDTEITITIEEFFENVVPDTQALLKPDNSRAPGRPTAEDGFIPPKKWDGEKVKHPGTGQYGWPDKTGKVWVPSGPNGHGGPHWDVIDKKGGHDNVLPGGNIRGQK